MKADLSAGGPALSRIVAGAWRWKLETTEIERLIYTALDAGISSFDHADIYGDYANEERFGKILRGNPSLRNRMELITKCGIKLVSAARPEHRVKHYDTSKEHILRSVENSLKNLSTDRLDLLLIHRPDPLMHPEEVAEAFRLLKDQGKVLWFGVSNFSAAQFEMLQAYVPVRLVTNQVEISLFNPVKMVDGTVDALIKHRVSPLAWSPLGGGKYFTASGQAETIEMKLEGFASNYNCTVSQLLLAWLLRHPANIFPILGTTNPDRVKEGAGAIHIKVDRQDWFAMLKAVTGKDVP
ncbi:MAG: aldo/keto reductase [Flammeovirgaceae bacterium]|nr:MAG: aldo/keto reductase [Flammeovirgaceae bacterium]